MNNIVRKRTKPRMSEAVLSPARTRSNAPSSRALKHQIVLKKIR